MAYLKVVSLKCIRFLNVGETSRAGRYGPLVIIFNGRIGRIQFETQNPSWVFLNFRDIGKELAIHWIKFSVAYKLEQLDNEAWKPVLYL